MSAPVAADVLDALAAAFPAPMLPASDLRWSPSPLPAADVLGQSADDVIVSLLVDADSSRSVAQAAIGALHDLQHRHDRLHEQHQRLRDEFRCVREATLREAMPP